MITEACKTIHYTLKMKQIICTNPLDIDVQMKKVHMISFKLAKYIILNKHVQTLKIMHIKCTYQKDN